MIVEQVIVMGQEESGNTVSIISFMPYVFSLTPASPSRSERKRLVNRSSFGQEDAW